MRLIAVALLCSATLAQADDTVLLRQQNTVVTESAFKAALESWLPEKQRSLVLASEKKVRDLLAKLFVQYKLADEAKARGLNASEQARFDHEMRRVLSQIQIEHLTGGNANKDVSAEAKALYDNDPDKYTQPEQVRVSHILISSKTRPQVEAMELAQKVLGDARKEDADFAKLAMEYSDDPSAKGNGGDLGYFEHGKMVKPFEDAAFALRTPGEIVGPVETGFGYHIIRFVDRKASVKKSYEEVAERIQGELRMKHRNDVLSAEYERIGTLPDIEIDQDAIKKIVVTPQWNSSRQGKADEPTEKP